MTKSKIGKMGEMWIKAGLIINEFLEQSDSTFLNSTLDWYGTHYRYLVHNVEEPSVVMGIPDGNQHACKKSMKISVPKANFPLSHENNKLLSIVIPIYNHYEYLNDCFQSIYSQSFTDFEVICIDDHSSDPQIRNYLKDLELSMPNITVYFSNENLGIPSSLNKGVELAIGRYIAFLDCDDYLPSHALEEVYKFVTHFPEVDYFFSDKIDIDENGNFLREALYGGYDNIHPSGNIEDDLLDGMVASHLKVIKRDSILELGGLKTNFNGVQDYDLAFRILRTGKLKYINKPLYFHRQHSGSVTKSQTVSQFRKMNLARRNYCDTVYPKKKNTTEVINYFKECIISGMECSQEQLTGSEIRLFTVTTVTIAELKKALKQRMTIILDARVKYNKELKYFVREYNSYFDLILTDDSQIAISILGSLWNDQILWMPAFLDPSVIIDKNEKISLL